MTLEFLRPRVSARLLCVALVGGAFAFAPTATRGDVVSSADLTLERASDGHVTWWRPSLALAAPAAEYGLAPSGSWLPLALVSEDRDARDAAPSWPTRAQQLAFRATRGPSHGHGTLTELRADWRLHAGDARRGGWLSIGSAGVAGDDHTLRLPLLGFGAWTRRQGVSLAGQLDQTPGYSPDRAGRSILVPDQLVGDTLWIYRTETEPAVPGELVTITRAQVRAGFGVRRVAAELAAGVDVARRTQARRWVQGTLELTVVPRVRLFGSYGSPPTRLFAGQLPDHSRASFGVRLAPEANFATPASSRRGGELESWRLVAERGGRHRMIVHARGATSVELMGDVTDWQPIALTRLGQSRWEIALEMASGVHQVLVRADGGVWQVPPRMTTTTSEFAGTVGVLVVE